MADFSVNNTGLSEPQGRGANPIAPAQVAPVNTVPMGIISTIGDVFAKGLALNAKDEAEKRKNAVIGDYTNSEKTFAEAMESGQWNAAQVAAASRSKYMQLLAAYPEYTSDLVQARSAVYGGTEIGEAEKKQEAAFKLRQTDMAGASAAGFTFFDGMSKESEDKTLDAWKTSLRIDAEQRKYREAAAEERAQRADQRAEESHGITTSEYYAKQNAIKGITELADRNFDVFASNARDVFGLVQSGKLQPQQAALLLKQNADRINAAITAVARTNPELAAPWTKLFTEMADTANQLSDPTKKSATDLQLLKDQFETLVTKQKLMAVESDKDLLKAVAGTALFPGQPLIGLSSVPAVKKWVLDAAEVEPGTKPVGQMVGTKDDGKLFKTVQTQVEALQSGKIPANKQEQATKEAVNTINNLLRNTTTVDGSIDPKALKNASVFFASSAFGKMALEGKIDKETASNAARVFKVRYDSVVKDAILRPLQDAKLADRVEITVQGNNVVFQAKEAPKTDKSFVEGLVGHTDTAEQFKNQDAANSFKEAQAGLNQLIRMHAHLEGTTDYAKYWENNKHILMPDIYPDPSKLKPGQVVNGYKYNGGNYRNRSNWTNVQSASAN